jgi:hypothetical protein
MAFPSRNFRILVLLLILLFVSVDTWLTRERALSWDIPQWLVIYPVNADGSEVTATFLAQLQETDFEPIESFFHDQATDYHLGLDRPIEVKLAPMVTDTPPAIPVNGKPLDIIWWSLRLRYWAWRHNSYDGPVDLQLFVQFFDPAGQVRLRHSTGLEKGRVGIVNAFAGEDYQAQNAVVISHEALHIFGATDKYDLANNQPFHPDGFAEPDLQPLYPQDLAELMGGRIPLSDKQSRMPLSLDEVIIGPLSATEIRWHQQ